MVLLVKLALLTLSVLISILHYVLGRRHFVSPRMAPGALVLVGAALLGGLVLSALVIAGDPPIWAMLAGIALEAASLALFHATIRASRQARLLLVFDPDLPQTLLESGPYRLVRHPFYTSYLLYWLGFGLGTWSVAGAIIFAIMLALYVSAARGEEAKFARTSFAANYAAYRTRAGMFWPLWRRSAK